MENTIRSVEKKYNFYSIYKHSNKKNMSDDYDENGNSYDLSVIDQALLNRYNADRKFMNLIKLDNHSYAGITNIICLHEDGSYYGKNEKVNLSEIHFWAFNIERADTLKGAVVVQVKENITNGRKTYGENPDEGAANDTVVFFNPLYGVVVLPPRAGMNIGKVKQYFYKITNPRQRGLYDNIIIDNTNIDNLNHIDTIKAIDFRVSKIASDDDIDINKSSGLTTFNNLNNNKLEIKMYNGKLNVSEAIRHLKDLFGLKDKKLLKFDKVLINGMNNDEPQTIELITNRMIAQNKVQVVEGKIPMSEMLNSVIRAYMSNKTKLDVSHAKKGKGV